LVYVGPLSIAIDVRPNTFTFYKTGVWDGISSTDIACSNSSSNHGMVLVGYGSENGLDYYLIKNSWGFKWGDDGFIKLFANGKNLCGICNLASVPIL